MGASGAAPGAASSWRDTHTTHGAAGASGVSRYSWTHHYFLCKENWQFHGILQLWRIFD
ncbi:hypothetical protein J2S55_001911 [Streptosporangium brasiliense]|uniref:Uncharacterized protein n=1 Tax=Streptosporangium brasiliense TaxID=47480 RepID=A0ABT9R2M3_9ACTN|nr:hypothetical protein [Streptosporangium brasiliense]